MKATLLDGTVLAGNVEELSAAVRAIQGRPAASAGAGERDVNGTNSGKLEGTQGTTVWTLKRARKLWSWLYGDQRKLVQFLLDKGGSATTQDIMKYLGMKKGNELAGVRSCITRNARRETAYREADVIGWALGDDGKWRYKLVPEVHELLKQIVAT